MFKTKSLIPFLTLIDMQEMEKKGILSMDDIGWNDKETLAPWKTSTAITKRKLTVLMNWIAKFGHDSNKV